MILHPELPQRQGAARHEGRRQPLLDQRQILVGSELFGPDVVEFDHRAGRALVQPLEIHRTLSSLFLCLEKDDTTLSLTPNVSLWRRAKIDARKPAFVDHD